MKIIKFSSLWCPSCYIMNKRLNELKKDFDFELIEYDYDVHEDEVKKHNIGKKLPVLIFMSNNTEISRIIGEKSKEDIIDILRGKNEKNNN